MFASQVRERIGPLFLEIADPLDPHRLWTRHWPEVRPLMEHLLLHLQARLRCFADVLEYVF